MGQEEVLLPEPARAEKNVLENKKLSVIFHGPLPPPQKISGLESLAVTTALFTIAQHNEEKIPLLDPSLPSCIQTYKIYDSRGQFILTAGEVRQPPFLFLPQWKTQIFICSAQGLPIILLANRNEGCFVGTSRNPLYEACYHADRKIARALNQRYKASDGSHSSVEEEPIRSHVHLKDIASGKFIGHLYRRGEEISILDANYKFIFAFKERDSLVESLKEEREGVIWEERLLEENKDSGGSGKIAGRSISVGGAIGGGTEGRSNGRSRFLSSMGSMRKRSSGDEVVVKRRNQTNYELVEEGGLVGTVDSHSSLRKLMADVPSEDCFTCTFPREFTHVDKALVLSFALFMQRTEAWGENFLHLVMLALLVVILLLTLIVLFLAAFYRFEKEFP